MSIMRKTVFVLMAALVFFSGCVQVACPTDYSPVCGANGKTYSNDCYAGNAGTTVLHAGRCAAQAVCDDSDMGRDALVAGTATATDGTGYSDECGDSLTVVEYYCDGADVTHESIACPSGLVCLDGACVPLEVTHTCEDSEAGMDSATKGTVVFDGESHTDACDNGTLIEYYCEGNLLASESVECPDGCAYGTCTNQSCRDTEYSNSIYAGGTVNLINGSGWFSYPDNCSDDMTVLEHYCDGDELRVDAIACPSGYHCGGGVCYPDVLCHDTDGGGAEEIFEAGRVYFEDYEYGDSCASSSRLKEYSCSSDGWVMKTVSCPSGYECRASECAKLDECTDSDGGKDYREQGTTREPSGFEAVDVCVGSTSLLEYFCSEDELVDSLRYSCPSGQSCSEGRCVDSSPCTDSDGGMDYYEKGKAEIEGVRTETDRCDNGTLVEYYCGGTYSIGSLGYECTEGYACKNGACVDYCTETDGGNSPETAGDTYFGSRVFADYCVEGGAALDRLVEYYCAEGGSAFASTEYVCSGECKYGRCTPMVMPD